MDIIPFEPGHLQNLVLQPAQRMHYEAFMRPEYGEILGRYGIAWTGLRGELVLCCAGFMPQWAGRAIAWALFSDRLTPREFLQVDRRARVELERLRRIGYARIETPLDPHFLNGLRWAKALGFAIEGLMQSFAPDGRDMYLAARVRPACSHAGSSQVSSALAAAE